MEQNEKTFTIVETDNMCTLAFLINEPEAGTDYCTLQKLDYTLPDASDAKKKMFHLEVPEGDLSTKDIVLLTMNKDKAFMNAAIFDEGKFYLSKKPTPVGFNVIFSEENSDYKDVKYTPNFKRPISIIDPEIADEVKPVLYYDENANMVKSKVKLQSNKSYIILEAKNY